MIDEIWKDVVGYEGLYQVSNFGRVKSLDRLVQRINCGCYIKKGKIKKQQDNGRGYLTTMLCDGTQKRLYIHRLVAEAFIENPKNKKEINHKDGNKKNNKAENLEWCSSKENKEHAWKIGLYIAKPITVEMKKRISQTVKQLWKDGIYRNKKKIEYTAELRKKMSDIQKQLPHYRTMVRCIETGEVFDSMEEASFAKCGTKSSVKCYFSGKQKLAGGYNWEKLNQKSLVKKAI